MQIYVYIGAFWLAFGLILHHCSPWRGESPKTPRELRKTAKCKCKIGKILQILVSELYFEAQSNKSIRESAKKQ